MRRPYRRNPWPYVRKDGLKSYRLGFYDHDGVERTKSFPSARDANAWSNDYATAAVRGNESLRRFLLDLDAVEAHAAALERPLAEVVQLWFALHADPINEGGLAPSTFDNYRRMANKHILGGPSQTPKGKVIAPAKYAVTLANTPISAFNEPAAPRAWRAAMKLAKVPAPSRDRAWKVLSSALSWAADDKKVPEVQTNGCLLASEHVGSKRRSVRRGGTGHAASASSRRPKRGARAHWALSPMATELVRTRMQVRVVDRNPLLALRDASMVSVQYGLACRDQELYGLRWGDVHDDHIDIHEVLSWGQLDDGKTFGSERRVYFPSLLSEDLGEWKTALQAADHHTRPFDFVFPGDLGGSQWGVREPDGGCHFSGNQARVWGRKFFTPAVKLVAEYGEGYADIRGATPYSLRRGGISLRLRAEDSQEVADQCGTSLQMLDRHYSFAIDDLHHQGPRPADKEWRAARAAVVERSNARQLQFALSSDDALSTTEPAKLELVAA
jgi:integrase